MNFLVKSLTHFTEKIFIIQVDPWTREVSKKRVAVFVVIVLLMGGGVIFNTIAKPLETLAASKNDKARIADLDKLKEILVKFQQDTGTLPQVPPGVRFLVGGASAPTAVSANWLGVDLSKYTNLVPVDPKFSQDSTAPYPYRYTTDGFTFKLDAFLEANAGNLMQQDTGILNAKGTPLTNRARYEVGTNLLLKF